MWNEQSVFMLYHPTSTISFSLLTSVFSLCYHRRRTKWRNVYVRRVTVSRSVATTAWRSVRSWGTRASTRIWSSCGSTRTRTLTRLWRPTAGTFTACHWRSCVTNWILTFRTCRAGRRSNPGTSSELHVDKAHRPTCKILRHLHVMATIGASFHITLIYWYCVFKPNLKNIWWLSYETMTAICMYWNLSKRESKTDTSRIIVHLPKVSEVALYTR